MATLMRHSGVLGTQVLVVRFVRRGSMVTVFCCLAACGRSEPTSSPVHAAPPLPQPVGVVVQVRTATELRHAIRSLQSNTTVMLAPGRYVLDEPLRIGDSRDAPLVQVSIRGGTGNPADVTLEERGIAVDGARDLQIADLSFVRTRGVSLLVQGNRGAERLHVYNVRFADSSGQMLRATAPTEAAAGGGGGIVEHSVFEYTTNEDDHRSAGAIAISGGAGWIIRYNTFRNIASGADAPPRFRPAVVARDGSADTVAHNNVFIDCERSIVYGMGSAAGPVDHTGGAIYNNFIYRRRGSRGDAGIMLWAAAGTRVHHNTVIQNGTYQRAIEYRFASSSGIDVRNNLTDGAIEERDGARAVLVGNYTKATAGMFRGARSGNLRLAAAAVAAIDKGVHTETGGFDWDGDVRPVGARPDIGADEFNVAD